MLPGLSAQISEPLDPVVWIDGLTQSAFAAGFGLTTPMLDGQGRQGRYYSQVL
jgi:hypothetical protein